LWYLDLEPELMTPFVSDLVAAMRRTRVQPFFIQRALLIALEKCEDDKTFRQAADFAMSQWPKPRGNGGWEGSTTFPMAVLHACPTNVAKVAAPRLARWPHRAEMALLRKIGAPAIPALEAERKKSSGKATSMIDKALKELRTEDDVEKTLTAE
jgi:hypothetical protein